MHVLLYADCDDNNNNQDAIHFEYYILFIRGGA